MSLDMLFKGRKFRLGKIRELFLFPIDMFWRPSPSQDFQKVLVHLFLVNASHALLHMLPWGKVS